MVHDRLTLTIALAAIILFTITAGSVLPHLIRAWDGRAAAPDLTLTNALLLNVALILLGWHRYKKLSAELSERKISEEKMRQLADTDHLTGALNRRSFTEAASSALSSQSDSDRHLAAIAIDLDNFKQVNDLNGHATGDIVLKEISTRVSSLLPPDAIFARLGGDEFACLLPYDSSRAEQVEHFAGILIERVSAPIKLPSLAVEVTLSIGIASSADLSSEDRATGNAGRLIHKADIAMYRAKKKGKNRFFWFEEAMETELRFRNQLEAGIRKGIANGEFVPYYEQQIDLGTGELTGFEMLARWISPELGLVGPDIFIPIAEDIGVIAELSEMLISQAFEDAKEWASHLTVSVNISPVQMRDPWFAQKILKLLVQHRFPPHRLDIEVTESCLHENVGLVRSMITSLKNQGVRISLDDFGVGYSSLSQLRSLPFDRLKIDKSFVSELRKKDESAKLVDAIISMSKGLQMPVTAEGIEDAEVLEALQKMGQMKGQGYHYGRPEPIEAVRIRLAGAGLLRETEDEEDEICPASILAAGEAQAS
ncbi:EAL domain-containing protein [Erythrobacter litoralis]|nr:EAL domain-containing protein [Erythrobacter litoralis]